MSAQARGGSGILVALMTLTLEGVGTLQCKMQINEQYCKKSNVFDPGLSEVNKEHA